MKTLKSQFISVGGVRYKAEMLYDNNALMQCEYVMLRSYAFKNNILYDTDLYFVEKELVSLYIKKKYNEKDNAGNEDLTSGLLFPAVSVNDTSITIDIRQFNQDINEQYFSELNEPINDFIDSPLVYKLYKKTEETSDTSINNFEETSIKCNTLRIYRPHTSENQNIILHCYTYINNIKVHILCRDLNWYTREENESKYCSSNIETISNHNFYTWYTDIPIPDLDYLFFSNNYIYYKENLITCDIAGFDTTTEEGKKMVERYKNSVYGQYTALSVFCLPFSIIKKENLLNNKTDNLPGTVNIEWVNNNTDTNIIEEAVYCKIYIPDLLHTSARAQLLNSYTVQLIPYDKTYKYTYVNNNSKYVYDKVVYGFGTNKCLVLSGDINSSTVQFFNESRIKLVSNIDFDDNGNISVLNEFVYPNKENKEIFPNFNAAYEYYNGTDLSQYIDIIDDEDEDGWYDPDYNENMQCGAVLEIFADKFYKDRLYKESYGFNRTEEGKLIIEDFSFSLTGLFSTWTQFPGVTFIRCTFVDKYIGKKIYGNVCTLVKEKFKFLINDDTKESKINTYGTSIIEKEYPDYYPNNIKDILKQENVMDKSRFNFLNNIKVNVIAPVSDNTTTNITVSNNINTNRTQRIIYKPIFYKVHDVNSIKLRTGIIQNVGVNLSDWMTKVETFKIIINTVIITEYARNDNYVIFNINTNNIVTATGTDTYSGEYHIINQDDEYITSGTWSAV